MANTTSSMSSNIHLYYNKMLLDRLTHNLVVEPLSEKSLTIPKGLGSQVKWLRYSERHVSSTSDYLLSEGVTPSDIAITTANVTATTAQYGNYAQISDLLSHTAIDPVVENIMAVMSDEAAELFDILCIAELDSNLPNQFANGKANLAATGASDVMTAKEALKGVITLQKDSVRPHSNGMYVCVVHPASKGDLHNDTNIGSLNDIYKHTDNGPLMNGEIAKAYQTKFLMSENITSTAVGTLGSATVYSNLLIGKGCFGTAKLGSKTIETYIKDPIDPLNQISTVGWKSLGFVAKYLGGSGNSTEDRGVRIRCGSGF